MKWAVLAAGLVAASGCELIFSPGGAPGKAIDAAGEDGVVVELDARVDAAPLCSNGTALVETYAANADTTIISTNPTQAFGDGTVANIGVDLRSRGLFRFAVRTDLGAPVAIELVVPYAGFQDDCDGPCGSCASIDRGGGVHASIAMSSWVELEANWNVAQAGVGWSAPGADMDDVDRSLIRVSGHHEPGEPTTLRWAGGNALEAWTWVSSGQLSVLVIPEGDVGTGTVIVSTTREGVDNMCVAGDQAATLAVTYCL